MGGWPVPLADGYAPGCGSIFCGLRVEAGSASRPTRFVSASRWALDGRGPLASRRRFFPFHTVRWIRRPTPTEMQVHPDSFCRRSDESTHPLYQIDIIALIAFFSKQAFS